MEHRAERALYYFTVAVTCTGSLLIMALVLATRNGIVVWGW